MNAFFFLPPVAEPDLYDVAVHAETVRHVTDLLGARLWAGGKQSLQCLPQQLINVRSLLAASRRHRVERQRHRRSNSHWPDARIDNWCWYSSDCYGRCRSAAINIAEPLLEQRLKLAHVLEAQVKSFKARDGRLREIIAVQFSHRHANVTLCKTCSQCANKNNSTR